LPETVKHTVSLAPTTILIIIMAEKTNPQELEKIYQPDYCSWCNCSLAVDVVVVVDFIAGADDVDVDGNWVANVFVNVVINLYNLIFAN
jgi:hypothetical protein